MTIRNPTGRQGSLRCPIIPPEQIANVYSLVDVSTNFLPIEGWQPQGHYGI